MPIDPRSCTANSSSASSTSGSPWTEHAVTASIQLLDRWLVVPAEALPAQHAEVADDPDRPGRVALDDRGVERLGQHHQVALRAGGPVEDHPLVAVVRAAQEPARQPVGEAPGGVERVVVQRGLGDVEAACRPPTSPGRTPARGSRRCSRPAARGRAGAAPGRPPPAAAGEKASVTVERQPALLEVFGEPSHSPGHGVRHRADAIAGRRRRPSRHHSGAHRAPGAPPTA